jgi:hypothetical protein
MGYEGNIVIPFVRLLKDLYSSRYASIIEPKKFKSAIGKYHE